MAIIDIPFPRAGKANINCQMHAKRNLRYFDRIGNAPNKRAIDPPVDDGVAPLDFERMITCCIIN